MSTGKRNRNGAKTHKLGRYTVHYENFFCGLVLCLVAALHLLMTGGVSAAPAEKQTPKQTQKQIEQERFFEAKIRPALVQHCIECHGPDDQSGELRLDTQAYFQRGGGSGALVVAGKPDASRLVRAIGYRDNELQMPPDEKLPEETIQAFRRWVEQGAYWPAESEEPAPADEPVSVAEQIESQRQSHWAFQPIRRPELPGRPTISTGQPPDQFFSPSGNDATAIDQFVRARLSSAGLAPNPPAARRTLIHRAYFTLTGLPPSFDEVESFVVDDDPLAFERLIDRLLDDPHYGERWARHWLDIARYGDTKGYLAGSQETRYPFAFTYRDYVIDAFNDDKPFDEFIIEQLAADQLDLKGDQRRSLAAMGYLTVGRRFMNRRHDIIDDQIDVITRGFMGISVSCARCHDHKYDPVPTGDYYSLYGVLDSSEEPSQLPLLADPKPSPQYDAFLKAKAAKQQEVDDWLEQRRGEAELELRSRIADYFVFFAESLPLKERAKIKFQGKRGPLRRAAVMRWYGFLTNPKESSHPVWELWRQLAAIPADKFKELAPKLIDEAGKRNQQFEQADLSKRIPASLLSALREASLQSMPQAAQIIGDQFEAVHQKWVDAQKSDAAAERLPGDDHEILRRILHDARTPTSLDREQMIAHLDQGNRNRYNQLRNAVNGIDVTHPGAPPRGMVMVDKATPVEPVIFRRGISSNRGAKVPRRFLQVLSAVDGGQPFRQGSGRLELAKAIASPKNPLTARVIVNRIWQHHFGDALVRTPSDFGVRGQPPTHPQLLDYLAAEFLADGWSIKRLHRRIMLSAVWQQSSKRRTDGINADPENRLLWHMPRRRLEFEPLRDRLLIAAGRLDDRVGGRSVMIHEDATRRGLYAYIDREDLPGLLASFDVPSPDASRAQRTRTTVPQQALYLMNSAFVIDQAKALAKRCQSSEFGSLHAGGRTDKSLGLIKNRIRWMYRIALARNPEPEELRLASEFVVRNSPSSGTAKRAGSTTSTAQLESWEQLAQVLLLSNEFTFID